MERPRKLFKVSFVIFRCKKGYMEMTKKIYLETLKSVLKALHSALLIPTAAVTTVAVIHKREH